MIWNTWEIKLQKCKVIFLDEVLAIVDVVIA